MADFDGFDYGNSVFTGGGNGSLFTEGNDHPAPTTFNGLLSTEGYLVHATLGAGEFYVYRMRGYDSVLGRIVYWDSLTLANPLDAYVGPGTPTDVVLTRISVEG
jgi:hypothetical protein